MISNEVSGKAKRGLVDPAFYIFSAAATVATGILVFVAWLTGLAWIAAFIPVAPAVITVVMSLRRGEKDILKELLRSLTNGKVGGRWFAVSSLLLPSIAVLALIIYMLIGLSGIHFTVPRVGLVFAALPLALCNELGWRGYAPLLVSQRKGLFVKSVIIGVAWVVSIAPIYALSTPIPLHTLAMALIPLSVLGFWLIANTKSLLMSAVMATFGLITVSFLPILPGDAGESVTFWLIVGLLWISAVGIVAQYGTDGLDGTIHELPADELPVEWEKIMPRDRPKRKLGPFQLNGHAKSKAKGFSAVGRKTRR
ncbi:MAG TPA: hypothetical protein VIL33_05340 [Rhodothermia bacterium]